MPSSGVFEALERGLIYFPSRRLLATPAAAGLVYEDVWLRARDGVRLHGWWVPAPSAATVLFFHGNAGNIGDRIDTLAIFHRLSLSTLIVDYRGYGQSEGQPSELGTYQDAEAAYEYLTKERGISPARLAVVGRSLGGGVASYVAARFVVGALVLESTFTSIPDLAAELYHVPFLRQVVRTRYDNLSRVCARRCPLLVVHSRDDEVVPFRHGRRLFDEAPEPKDFLELRGSHADGFLVSAETYTAGLKRFLTSALGLDTAAA
ncbi:MAG: alpha/beta hydrolase [Candidatus Dadabacteria bacterium]|nr:MAG: alpha/beta hydrolase [Candidatus Dadabacteria bacterium]